MKDYSLKSGERFHSLDTNLVSGDHLWRYRYTAQQVKKHYKNPFGADIFCGSGYGAKLLADEANAFMLAIDGSPESVECANERVFHSNIIYAQKLFPFNLPEETFDFVASMESLEHVKDYEAFFWVLAKSIKKGGRLFISSPDENTLPYGGYIWHYKHFRPDEVRTMAKESGLREVAAYSTSCQIMKDGKAHMAYFFQMGNETPKELNEGDTLFFEFSKDA